MVKTSVDRDGLVFGPPELGCVLYLSGLPGGSSKVYDKSPYGSHGTITGATWERLTSELWCLRFDGLDDYTECQNMPSLNITNEISVEFWCRIITPPAGGVGCLMSKDAVGSNRAWKISINSGGHFYYEIFGAGNGGMDTTPDSYEAGQWYHLCFTFRAGTRREFFVNAASVLSDSTITGSIPSTTCAIVVAGIDYVVARECVNADIALVRVYRRVLSAFEVQNQFNREKHLFGAW